MKKILLITYHFPPDAAMGAVRVSKFAKFLPEFDWEPVVLSVQKKYYDALDTAHHPGTSSPRVIRTRMFQKPIYYYHKAKKALSLRQRNTRVTASSDLTSNGSLVSKVKNLIDFYLAFPDEKVGWVPFAIFHGMKLIRREAVTALMTSGPPHSVHLIGACLCRLTQTPWVIDFRDPYLDDVFKDRPGTERGLSGYLTRRLEAWLIAQAAVVLASTERFSERLRSRYPAHKQKIFTIPNGYDLDDFSAIRKKKEKGFTISYLGSIYEQRDPEPVFRAVSELIQEKQIDPGKVIFRLVGNCSRAKGKSIERLVSKYDLNGNVQILPWIPRREALEMMVRSSVLLLLAEDQPLAIPGKVYDYLASGSDILALTREGATADVLRETRGDGVVTPDDYEDLKSKIKALYTKHLSADGDVSADCPPPVQYSRRYLTKKLAMLLDAVSRTHHG